jgi:hypothetical protein
MPNGTEASKPLPETRARVNAYARETDTQFMEQLRNFRPLRPWGGLGQMTVLTMRFQRGHFVVTGPDIEPLKFKSRREAKDWCAEHHRAPIKEIGANAVKRASKG